MDVCMYTCTWLHVYNFVYRCSVIINFNFLADGFETVGYWKAKRVGTRQFVSVRIYWTIDFATVSDISFAHLGSNLRRLYCR